MTDKKLAFSVTIQDCEVQTFRYPYGDQNAHTDAVVLAAGMTSITARQLLG